MDSTKSDENALVIEFGIRQIAVDQQRCFPILYKQVHVGEYMPDLIVGSEVIVDAKVVDTITDRERGQVLNYLRISGLKIALILNFKHPRLEWERIVL